jgi:phospholipid/cholesterol/gamma-HCH transport system permease protein
MPIADPPSLLRSPGQRDTVMASGTWRVEALAGSTNIPRLQQQLARERTPCWDLTGISGLDHIGAQLFWNAWGKTRPAQLRLAPQHEAIFQRIEQAGALQLPADTHALSSRFATVTKVVHATSDHVLGFLNLIGQLMLDLGQFLRAPQRGPWKEISATIFHTGYQALGVTALVGLLIGIVLSYLSAQQLHQFGGDIYLVNILGMSIIRELGPLLAALLVAGRSGSANTAQLGVMRVTEELDAMLVMGLPHGFRLVMPRVIALALSMPLLVIWTDAIALIGGMIAAKAELGLSPAFFLQKLPGAVPIANYWIGLGKGFVFGCLIGLVACHFGLRIAPNTESLGHGTTWSVVTAITAVIIADAVFAIVFSDVGY